MCLSTVGRILAIEADQAVVELDGRVRRASLVRMPDISVGDWALVAAGTVVRRLDADEAADIRGLLRSATPEPADAAPPGGPR